LPGPVPQYTTQVTLLAKKVVGSSPKSRPKKVDPKGAETRKAIPGEEEEASSAIKPKSAEGTTSDEDERMPQLIWTPTVFGFRTDSDEDYPVTGDDLPEVAKPLPRDWDGSVLTDIPDPNDVCPIDDTPGDAGAAEIFGRTER
jgi:hypothetical protein